MNQQTLVDRINHRWETWTYRPTTVDDIRIELDRLARKIKRQAARQTCRTTMYDVAIHDVLRLIKEAKK